MMLPASVMNKGTNAKIGKRFMVSVDKDESRYRVKQQRLSYRRVAVRLQCFEKLTTCWILQAAMNWLSCAFLIASYFGIAECIKCFQCSSTEDQRKPTGVWSEDHYTQNRYEDNCGVYWPFEPDRNVPVECNSDESHTPGTFCVKITRQGPRGFICKFIYYYNRSDD